MMPGEEEHVRMDLAGSRTRHPLEAIDEGLAAADLQNHRQAGR
jgi:hypothetical protein